MVTPDAPCTAPRCLPDEVLARAVARPGGEEAFAELHRRHDAALRRFCLGLVRHREDATDAVQDTWMRAYSQLGDASTRVLAVRPWLYAIARNACLDRLRARRPHAALDDLADSLASPDATEDAFHRREELDALLADLAGLSESQRSALVLHEVAGLQTDEIAGMLGTTADRARWLLADARTALRSRRTGRDLDCEEARRRLRARRPRDRVARAHLDACPACAAAERSRRARLLHTRCLAPVAAIAQALRGLLGAPRETLALLAGGGDAPAAAAKTAVAGLLVGLAVGGGAMHHRSAPDRPAAAAPAPRAGTAAPARAGSAARTRAARPAAAAVRHHPRPERRTSAAHRSVVVHARSRRPHLLPRPAAAAARRPEPASPSPTPAPAPSQPRPSAPPAPTVSATVERVSSTLRATTRRVVSPVADAVDRVLPAPGSTVPVVDATLGTVRRTLDALAGR
jgi:RNA polymerase sigma factor (sigma-70 family)